MKKILLVLFLMFGYIGAWGQRNLDSRKVLVDSIAINWKVYVTNGVDNFIDDEFSLLNYPFVIWNYIAQSKEERKEQLETKMKEFVLVDSITQIANQQIEFYNKQNEYDQIRPITINQVQGVVSDQAVQAVQDRAFLDVADGLADWVISGIVTWIVVWIATTYVIAPWLSARIYNIDLMETFGHEIVNRKTSEGSTWNKVLNVAASVVAQSARQSRINEARRMRKNIKKWTMGILTICMIVWQLFEAPKREARAKKELVNSYIEVLSAKKIKLSSK